MKKLYYCETRIGQFYIAEHNGRFHSLFDNKSLGSYVSIQQAVEDLVGGHTFSMSTGIDTSELGMPDEIAEWKRINTKNKQES